MIMRYTINGGDGLPSLSPHNPVYGCRRTSDFLIAFLLHTYDTNGKRRNFCEEFIPQNCRILRFSGLPCAMKKAGRIVLPDPDLNRAHCAAYAFIMRFSVCVANSRISGIPQFLPQLIPQSALFSLPVCDSHNEPPRILPLFRAQERYHSQHQADPSPEEELDEEACDA